VLAVAEGVTALKSYNRVNMSEIQINCKAKIPTDVVNVDKDNKLTASTSITQSMNCLHPQMMDSNRFSTPTFREIFLLW
jgi:hypothetical protein